MMVMVEAVWVVGASGCGLAGGGGGVLLLVILVAVVVCMGRDGGWNLGANGWVG